MRSNNLTDTEKIINEIESARSDQHRKKFVEKEALLEKLRVGHSHAEQRITRYEKWKWLAKELSSRQIEYKADDYLS